MSDAFKQPLFSQRREIVRVVQWLRSERFKCDHSPVQMNEAAAQIAALLESDAYVEETAWTRGDDGVDLGPRPSGGTATEGK